MLKNLQIACNYVTLLSLKVNNGIERNAVLLTDPQMNIALAEAHKAAACGEVPVGAALFDVVGNLICADHNRTVELSDPTAHAELLVIKKACAQLETGNLSTYTLVVTLEPCAMCAQAIAWAKVGKLHIGALDRKSGGVINGVRIFDAKTCHHRPEILSGIMAGICGQPIRQFFEKKRGVDT